MINNLADYVDRETLISQLSFVKDASEIVAYKEEEDKKEQEKADERNPFLQNEIPDANEEQSEESEPEELKKTKVEE